MRSTKHFAGVIGTAGIVVGPLLTTVVAQADDAVPPEWSDYSSEGDVPDLPVTRPVGKATSLDLLMIDNKPVSLDLPDEVKLPADGSKLSTKEAAKLQGTLDDYVVDGDLKLKAGSDVTFYDSDSLEGVEWIIDEEGRVVPKPKAAGNASVAGSGSATSAQTGSASNAGVAGSTNVVGESADKGSAVDDVTPESRDPELPVTGEDSAASATSPAEDATLPLAPLLGITGLALGGGIGVITLRKKLELQDSK